MCTHRHVGSTGIPHRETVMKISVGSERIVPLFLTSAVEGCKWSASRSGNFNPRETSRYLLDRRVGGLQGRPGHCGIGKNPPFSPKSKPSLAACPHTDWVILALSSLNVYSDVQCILADRTTQRRPTREAIFAHF